jgi:hypothetical protein
MKKLIGVFLILFNFIRLTVSYAHNEFLIVKADGNLDRLPVTSPEQMSQVLRWHYSQVGSLHNRKTADTLCR